MKKIFFLFFMFLSVINFAQKVKIKNFSFDIDIRNLDVFKNITTYSYQIQDDGDYWNHNKNKDKFPTLESFTKGIFY